MRKIPEVTKRTKTEVTITCPTCGGDDDAKQTCDYCVGFGTVSYPNVVGAVGVNDIAAIAGLSPASIRTYAKSDVGSLPEPDAHISNRPLWSLDKILKWADTPRPPGRRPSAASVKNRPRKVKGQPPVG